MISIAIVLILMLGINFVFSTSARTVSTGMAVTAVNREIRSARKVIESDFLNAVPAGEMPAIIIHNEMVYAWPDRQDKLADADNDPATYDIDGVPGDDINLGDTDPSTWANANLPGIYNHRRHRIDRISFFARNTATPFTRQTGDDNTYINSDTSPEAWIQYSLLRLADNSGITYWKPGARNLTGATQDERANHNNFFASQWMLGRRAMLLMPPSLLGPGDTIVAGPPTASGPGIQFGNLAYQVTSTAPGYQKFNREAPPYQTAAQWKIEESRVDVVASTIADIREAFRTGSGIGTTWWADADPTTTNASTNRDWRDHTTAPPAAATVNYLPWAKPFVNKSNFADTNTTVALAHQTREAALMTPIFMRGVTQFIVEFAGDFYDQGAIDGAGGPEPLGTIDYVPPTVAGQSTQIRWYGMTRDVNGDATITATDVQPLAVAPPVSPSGGTVAPRFSAPAVQKTAVGTGPLVFAWGPTVPGADPTAGSPGSPGNANNVRPSLVRITMELIDPNGRLEDGQRIELVFPLK